MLKMRIESLIEREYLARDRNSPHIYAYIAWADGPGHYFVGINIISSGSADICCNTSAGI